jgi:flagellar biosynthesis protein FliR
VTLSALTPTVVLTAFIVFCRIGGCLLVIPGFSSPRIAMRARLFVAIAVALALTPLLIGRVQPLVASAAPVTLLGLIVSETLKGLVIGLLGRIFFLALETMATAISMTIGLTSPMGVPIEDEEAGSPIVSMISLTAALLVFVTDLHWELFRGLAGSYQVLPIEQGFDPRVGLVQLTDEATRTFLLTLRIAAPFLVFSVVVNFAIGLINKLVPQIPVSFISTPFLLAGGFLILYFACRPALDLFIAAFGGWLRSG